jgi:hypothetical protein
MREQMRKRMDRHKQLHNPYSILHIPYSMLYVIYDLEGSNAVNPQVRNLFHVGKIYLAFYACNGIEVQHRRAHRDPRMWGRPSLIG